MVTLTHIHRCAIPELSGTRNRSIQSYSSISLIDLLENTDADLGPVAPSILK